MEQTDIEKLRELATKATPGPWYQSGSPWFQTGGFVLAGSPDPHAGTVLADLSDTWEMQRADEGLDADHERDPDDDAAFIAAANPAAVLSLLDRLAKAEEAVAALNERLENNRVYGMDGERKGVEPGSIPDGIECRDETIKLLDAALEAERSSRRKAEEALRLIEMRASHLQPLTGKSETSKHYNGGLQFALDMGAVARAALTPSQARQDDQKDGAS